MSWIVSICLVTTDVESHGQTHRYNYIEVDPDALESTDAIPLPPHHTVLTGSGESAHHKVYSQDLERLGWEYDADYGLGSGRHSSRFWLTFLNCPLSHHEILNVVQDKFPPNSVDSEELTRVLVSVMERN